MSYTLKVEFGKVCFLHKEGDKIEKFITSEEKAKEIISKGDPIEDKTYKGYPIKVGDYYFESKGSVSEQIHNIQNEN